MTNNYRTHTPHTHHVPSVQAELVILRGKARNRSRRICVSAYLIGAAEDCDLILSDAQYPDVHACILLRKQGVWLRHLGFMPEVTVNGTVVSRIQLKDGDRIRTGPYEFRIRIRGPVEGGRPEPSVPSWIVPGPHGLSTHAVDPEAIAIVDVRHLLARIHSELLSETSGVRLFRSPETTADTSPAARLPARSVRMVRPA